MKTLMTSTALSLLLAAGTGPAVAQNSSTGEYGRDALPEVVEESTETDAEGLDAATADEGTVGGGRGSVATAPSDEYDDPGARTQFQRDFYDLGYRERDGYIWEDGEFLTDTEGRRIPMDRADAYQRDAEGRFVTDDQGRVMPREDVATAPSDDYEDPGARPEFLQRFYDLGYEERDGMLFEDGEQVTDAEDRPVTTESYRYYETDDQGRLVTNSEGEPVLRDDAPEFSMSDEGEMEMERG